MASQVVETTQRHAPWVAPGFEEVRAEFDRNFAERGEIGAAVAAYWRGEKVVDLWGGRRTPTGDEPWNEDTMVVVNSTTKGLAAMTVAVANSRGWIDYEAPVAEYWPEFAQNGKGAITVRQLLSHEAGLVWIDEPLHFEDLRDLDRVSRAARAAEAGVGTGNATRLPRDDDRALHAGADPPRRPGAPHARPVLRRGDREAAADRVLHRAPAGDSRRAARAAEDSSLPCARSERCLRSPRGS